MITLGKSPLFLDHLNDLNATKLEKLNSYEPCLAHSYEFSCPNIYRIEKRICLPQTVSNETSSFATTFTIWWPNEGEIIWLNGTSQDSNANHGQSNEMATRSAISLLERDDLRNNVIVLSTNLNDSNQLEHMFKSDGLLLSLGYFNNDECLIAVEQNEMSAQKYTICIYKYHLPLNENEVNRSAAAKSDQKKTKDSRESLVKQQSTNDNKSRSLKMKLLSFNLNSKIVSVEQVKQSKKYIVMLGQDQTIVLYDIYRNLVSKYKLDDIINDLKDENTTSFYNGVEWLVNDLIFCLYDINGKCQLFDVAFNNLNIKYMSRENTLFRSFSEQLSMNIFQPYQTGSKTTIGAFASNLSISNANKMSNRPNNQTSAHQLNRFICIRSSSTIFTGSLWCCLLFSKGPLGLFRLVLPNDFNEISLLNHYLKNSQSVVLVERLNESMNKDGSTSSKYLNNSVKLLNTLDWNTEAHLALACLYKLMNFIFADRIEFNLKLEQLAENALACFYKPKRDLKEQIIYEYKHQVSRYARRFFYKLLQNDRLNKAFLLAVDIGSKDLFNDLYYCSLDRHEYQLAEICRKKYHDLVSAEQNEKLKNDLNRSITTIDDNIEKIKQTADRDSVSSSDNDSQLDSADENENENFYFDLMQQNGSLPSGTKRFDLNELMSTIENDREQQVSSEASKNPLIQTNQRKIPAAFASTSNKQIPKVYTEKELEDYAKKIYLDNRFIHQMNFDSFY